MDLKQKQLKLLVEVKDQVIPMLSLLGKFRRIVLYDTLVEQMEEDEIEAVLAH